MEINGSWAASVYKKGWLELLLDLDAEERG